MFPCVYVCGSFYVCVYAYVCMRVYTCITYVYMFVCMYTYMCVRVYNVYFRLTHVQYIVSVYIQAADCTIGFLLYLDAYHLPYYCISFKV